MSAASAPATGVDEPSRSRRRSRRRSPRACSRIAPLWPLKHFVAVNPFLGFTGQTFHATCATMHRVARIDMLMPRAFYREAIAERRDRGADLEAALAARAAATGARPRTVAEFKAALARDARPKAKHAAPSSRRSPKCSTRWRRATARRRARRS